MSIKNGYIYKISSTDNKMIYYNYTIYNIQEQYKKHIKNYVYYSLKHNLISDFIPKYKLEDVDYDDCYSNLYIIFYNYDFSNINIEQIEHLQNTTIPDLEARLTFYIHNFKCINKTDSNIHPKAFVYKISSPDNKYNYYGITTVSIQNRFQRHIELYHKYISEKTDYCSSFYIFDKYPIQDITIQIIEEHTHVFYSFLIKREKYYIQNFNCVNRLDSELYSTVNINKQKQEIIDNDIISSIKVYIHQPNDNIKNILNILGYLIDIDDNRLIQNEHIPLLFITPKLVNAINQYYYTQKYDLTNPHYILIAINDILKTHLLQIVTKITKIKFKKKAFSTYLFKIININN